MITVISVNGRETRYKTLDFAGAQRIVGGYVETVAVPSGVMLVNEDGRMLGYDINQKASLLAGQDIVGDVVLLTNSSVNTVLG